MRTRDYLEQAISKFKIQLTDAQLTQFETYAALLTEWNEKINLTAITDPQGIAVKHFADSLSVFNYLELPQNASVIDIGTGAGFPGVVLKIARPDIKLTLLDSLKKRFLFLEDLLQQLDLTAELIPGRAEEYGQDIRHREKYDLVVSRAVAQLNTLSEYCIPFVKLSGSFVAFKGGDSENEIKAAVGAIRTLGGKLKNIYSFNLPFEGGARTLAQIEKVHPTPAKYPRSNGRIKAKPL